MKAVTRFLSLALAGAFFASSLLLSPITALAEEAQAYTYTVKLHIGGNGSEGAKFTSDATGAIGVPRGAEISVTDDLIEITGLNYGDSLNFNKAASYVSLNPDEDAREYYVAGIRAAGADTKQSAPSFAVTKDQDFCIAYGVGATIPYTVKYVDASGSSLIPDETFYAKAGEELYVSYKYVDGYLPDAYNKHVTSLAEGTTITFTYTKGSHSVNGGTVNDGTSYSYAYVNGQTTTTYDYVQGEATTTGGTTVTGGNTSTGNTGNAGGADADAQGDDAQAEDATTIDDTESPTDGPVDIEEIGDTETPTHGGTESGITPATIAVVLAIIAVIALILIFFVIKIRRKKAGTK